MNAETIMKFENEEWRTTSARTTSNDVEIRATRQSKSIKYLPAIPDPKAIASHSSGNIENRFRSSSGGEDIFIPPSPSAGSSENAYPKFRGSASYARHGGKARSILDVQ
jgi:hypothetical protein